MSRAAVEASAPLINTESADVSSIRTNQQIETGAVNYRAGPVQGFVYFTMVLAPGAQRAQGSNFSFAGAAFGRHARFGTMCSMDFAGSYTERGQPPAAAFVARNF